MNYLAPLILVLLNTGSMSSALARESCFLEDNIADVLPIPAGTDPYAVLFESMQSQCGNVGKFQPWAGVPVYDQAGGLLGETGNLLLAKKGQSNVYAYFEIIGGSEPLAVAVSPSDLAFDKWHDTAALAVEGNVNRYVDGLVLDAEQDAKIAVVPYPELNKQTLVALWGNGGNPYPERIIVQFESDPPSAVVFVGEKVVGPTTVQAWVSVEALPKISVRLTGYSTCDYANGEFTEPTVTTTAMFRCTLSR